MMGIEDGESCVGPCVQRVRKLRVAEDSYRTDAAYSKRPEQLLAASGVGRIEKIEESAGRVLETAQIVELRCVRTGKDVAAGCVGLE